MTRIEIPGEPQEIPPQALEYMRSKATSHVFHVDLPEEDYATLCELADEESRSVEMQVRYLLRRSLKVERSMRAKTVVIQDPIQIEVTSDALDAIEEGPRIDVEAFMRP